MAKKRVGTMKKPMLEQFGLTSQEYEHLVSERTRLCSVLDRPPEYGSWYNVLAVLLTVGIMGAWLVGLLGLIAGFFVGWFLQKAFGLKVDACGIVGGIIGVSYVFIAILMEPYGERKKRARCHKQLSDPKYQKVAQYEDAIRRYEYRQQSYWKSLKGTKFERALARLYTKMGYSVSQTKGSGDEGIDLILSKEGKKTAVQCKGHKKSIGVSAVRDLYGAMMHFGADSAILACPAGFTKGVRKFVINKPIQLLSTTDFVEMAESVDKESANR